MKKLVALMLALMLALSGTLALAEQAAQPAPMTITSHLDINRDAVKELMKASGVPEEQITLCDTIFGIINTANENLVMADGGFEYGITLNDSTLLSLAGEADDKGIAIACSLVPSYVFTMSPETLTQMVQDLSKTMEEQQKKEAEMMKGVDMKALTDALTGYFTEYFMTCASAITPGQAQTGEFTVDEGEFNCMIPLNIDLLTVAVATNTLVAQLNADPTLAAALAAANTQMPEIPTVPVENLPTVMANLYVNLDEQGQTEDGSYIVLNVVPQDVEDPMVVYKQYTDSEEMWFTVEMPAMSWLLTYDQKNLGYGYAARVDANLGEMYMGANVLIETGDDTVVTTKLYYLDNVNPIATDVCTISPTGERTIEVRGSKKNIAIEDLMKGGKNAESISNQLTMDLMINGLSGAMNALSESTPEAGNLMNLLMGGGQAVQSAPVPAK